VWSAAASAGAQHPQRRRRPRRERGSRMSARNRGHCRPPTGAASPNCQPTTEATLSIMNRGRTWSLVVFARTNRRHRGTDSRKPLPSEGL
jgi:hypothetical protein